MTAPRASGHDTAPAVSHLDDQHQLEEPMARTTVTRDGDDLVVTMSVRLHYTVLNWDHLCPPDEMEERLQGAIPDDVLQDHRGRHFATVLENWVLDYLRPDEGAAVRVNNLLHGAADGVHLMVAGLAAARRLGRTLPGEVYTEADEEFLRNLCGAIAELPQHMFEVGAGVEYRTEKGWDREMLKRSSARRQEWVGFLQGRAFESVAGDAGEDDEDDEYDIVGRPES